MFGANYPLGQVSIRECELVARWILEHAGCKKPVKRLWISSVTDQAIRKGFDSLKDGRDYYSLFQAAVARAQADWLVGLNASRALTCKFNDSLSCGRVQTPTLGMVNEREQQIQNFKPQKLYGMKVTAGGAAFVLTDAKGNPLRTKDHSHIQKAESAVKGGKLTVKTVNIKERKKFAPPLYDLTSLQQEASSRFDFSAKETLRIMQGLYETHKILTYPRTDSKYLSSDIVPTLRERLRSIQIGPYKSHVTGVLKSDIKASKHFVDDSRVSDHHAIIPTEEVVDLSALSAKEFKIYDLVVKRFLGVLMKPSIHRQTSVDAVSGDHSFRYQHSELVDAGFEVLLDSEKSDSAGTPDFKMGEDFQIISASISEKLTEPPSRFTEGTLLGAMENPMAFMATSDGSKKNTLKETGGLGTVATRADIIEKLFNHNYMEKKGKSIYMTNRGKQLLKLVPEALKTPDLTAEWEHQLGLIAKGSRNRKSFIDELTSYTREIVTAIKNIEVSYRHDNVVSEKCPECGGKMLMKDNKYGKSVVCSDRNCGYRKNLSKSTNARCPNCHKKMSLVGEGEGKRFVCKCGYKEKLQSYNEKRQQKKKQAGKRDVNRYLNKQNKEEESFNNPFKDLLGKIE